VQRPLGNDERIRSKKSGPSAGGEAPRPSKFELPRAGGGPTRLTKPPKLHSFRLRGSQIREVPHFREGKSGLKYRRGASAERRVQPTRTRSMPPIGRVFDSASQRSSIGARVSCLTRRLVATWLDLARGNVAVNHSLGLPSIGTPHVSVQGILRSALKKNGPSVGAHRVGVQVV
jgi:hypothetical protein